MAQRFLPYISDRGFDRVTANLFERSVLPNSEKSPLRYPGGKTRAVKTIKKYLPEEVTELCAPFLGGGSVELACAADGIRVYGSDIFAPVVNFWQHALNHAASLANHAKAYYPLTRDEFYRLQKTFAQIDEPLEQAAVFFVLNRSSYSGTTLSGGMSPNHPRFTPSAIDRLRNFSASGLSVKLADYAVAMNHHKDAFLYLDPPYANGGKLYGKRGDLHDGFNHENLAELLQQRDGWLLSYNDCEIVRKLYKKFKIIEPEWTYCMSNEKRSKELLIVNA